MRTYPYDAAFARPTDDYCSTNVDKIAQTGLTKREYFAAMAMQGLLAHKGSVFHKEQGNGELVALGAVGYADALIAELNKEQK